MINDLESITEKEVEDDSGMDPTLVKTTIIDKMKIKAHDEDRIRELDRDLWAILQEKTAGEAQDKINGAMHGDGLWAYIKAHQWFIKTSEQGRTNRLTEMMKPHPCKHD